eukprot:TRINITY_DN10433_c1_g1_i1.p1 TRINITY_DN10433_c1_g1~~TRINITY_DN10433_c1_g1_i1.p1  ORF type:complete len:836 (+),score=174.48 TRINITY_DN10433_c1_g1_i1:95-2602(+)
MSSGYVGTSEAPVAPQRDGRPQDGDALASDSESDGSECPEHGSEPISGNQPAAPSANRSAKVERKVGLVEFEAYYALQELCSESDWKQCVKRLCSPLPPAFRIRSHNRARGGGETQSLLESLKPWNVAEVPWCPGAYRVLDAGPLGAKGRLQDSKLNQILVRAQRGGLIARQETASMLPPLVLQIRPEHLVLDLCAAPGSKTMQILELLHSNLGPEVALPPKGLLIANDLKSKRLNRILERARRGPAGPLLATCSDARKFPNLLWSGARSGRIRFDRVLCDVPCSGDGTVRKAKGLLDNWHPRGGLCHHGDQLAILCRGIELLAPGGLLAYSTCALNPLECEAVIAAGLSWGKGSVELVAADIPGLALNEGKTTWRVPAPAPTSDAPAGGVTYSSWEDVPMDDRNSGRLRRTMFPPSAYCACEEDAKQILAQLPLCRRLLPVKDDGGCFFLALLRRVVNVDAPLRRGDRVRVLFNGLEAIVRGPGGGPFKGLTRVAYVVDGSIYHVAADGIERIRTAGGAAAGGNQSQVDSKEGGGVAETVAAAVAAASSSNTTDTRVREAANEATSNQTTAAVAVAESATVAAAEASAPEVFRLNLPLQKVKESDWIDISNFWGLQEDDAESTKRGVQRFPKEFLVYGADPTFEGLPGTQPSTVLALASEALMAVGKAPNPRPALRNVFLRAEKTASAAEVTATTAAALATTAAATETTTATTATTAIATAALSEADVTPLEHAALWKPFAEVAQVLAACATKRVAKLPNIDVLRGLIDDHLGPGVEAAKAGADLSWPPGPILLVWNDGSAQPVAALGNLTRDGRVRIVFQRGFNTRLAVAAQE